MNKNMSQTSELCLWTFFFHRSERKALENDWITLCPYYCSKSNDNWTRSLEIIWIFLHYDQFWINFALAFFFMIAIWKPNSIWSRFKVWITQLQMCHWTIFINAFWISTKTWQFKSGRTMNNDEPWQGNQKFTSFSFLTSSSGERCSAIFNDDLWLKILHEKHRNIEILVPRHNKKKKTFAIFFSFLMQLKSDHKFWAKTKSSKDPQTQESWLQHNQSTDTIKAQHWHKRPLRWCHIYIYSPARNLQVRRNGNTKGFNCLLNLI